jgi:Fic family protein
LSDARPWFSIARGELKTLTLDVLKSSEIEGEQLNPEQVRSSVARRLGIEIAGAVPAERNVEGVVEMLLDATQRYDEPLSDDRLFGWHAFFPTGRSGMHNKKNCSEDAMRVTSGPMGKETIHLKHQVPAKVAIEMNIF